MIPTGITVNGIPLLVLLSRESAVVGECPGFPGWHVATAHNAGVIGKADYAPGAAKPIWLQVVNIGENAVELSWDGLPAPLAISRWSGWAWSDETQFDRFVTPGADPLVVDEWCRKKALEPDPKLTKSTGSGNMEFHGPMRVWSEKYGVTLARVAALFAYLEIQARRPRWWLAFTGDPMPIFALKHPEDPAPKIAGFDEWAQNAQGYNALDAMHYDVDELAIGDEVLAAPMFLDCMLVTWLVAQHHSPYWRLGVDHRYSGTPRIPGWLFKAFRRFRDSLVRRGLDGITVPLGIDAFVGQHVEYVAKLIATLDDPDLTKRWQIPRWSGSRTKELTAYLAEHPECPGYFQPWQFEILVLGLALVGRLELAKRLRDTVEDWHEPTDVAVYYELSVDEAFHTKAAGTGTWCIPAGVACDPKPGLPQFGLAARALELFELTGSWHPWQKPHAGGKSAFTIENAYAADLIGPECPA